MQDAVLFELQKKKKNSKIKQRICIEWVWLKNGQRNNPSLTTFDFWLFFALMKTLRWRQFRSDQELLTATQTFFNHILESITFEDKWQEYTQKCILRRGRYFEKDRSKNENVSSDSE